jgi:spore maturation protein CgeB
MNQNQSLEIAFFGSSLLSSYWNGAATYYRGIIRALHSFGHRVTFYEPDAFDRQQHRDIAPPEWANVHVYAAERTGGVYRALELARNSDWIIKASGVGVHDELLEREVLNAGSAGTMVAYWDVDAPATLERLGRDIHDPFHDLIPRYDVVFTYGGGNPVIEAYNRFGARRCVPIYNALDPSTHFPVKPDPAFAADLSFLGNRLPDREARVQNFFVRAAKSLPDSSFLLGGNGWEVETMPANVRYAGHVSTNDHNAFNSSANAVLNISRDSMARYGFSPATRVFEAAGAGACIITDAWDGIDMFFEPEREILVARNGEEVAGHLAALTESVSRSIGQAARKRAVADHAYANRAIQVNSILNGRLMAAGRQM